MKTFLLFLIIGSSVTLVAGQTNLAVLRVGTNVYQNATLKQLNPLECLITDDTGWHKVAFSNLTPDIQKRFNYDPTNAAAAMSAKLAREKSAQARSVNEQTHQLLAAKLKIIYDKFTGYTTYSPQSELSVEPKFTVLAICATQSGETHPDSYELEIFIDSNQGRFLEYHPFIIIADGKKYDFGEPEDKNHAFSDSLLEEFSITMPSPDFSAMAFAKTFEAKLGTSAFEFTYDEREDWRSLVNFFATLPTPASTTK